MNRIYLDDIAEQIWTVDAGTWPMQDDERMLYRGYAVLLLATGIKTTDASVHDAWCSWCAAMNPGHPSLVPFAELVPEIQAKDHSVAAAIRAVARMLSERQTA